MSKSKVAETETEVETLETEELNASQSYVRELSEDDEDIKQPAVLNFFEQFQDETDYTVTIYKKKLRK